MPIEALRAVRRHDLSVLAFEQGNAQHVLQGSDPRRNVRLDGPELLRGAREPLRLVNGDEEPQILDVHPPSKKRLRLAWYLVSGQQKRAHRAHAENLEVTSASQFAIPLRISFRDRNNIFLITSCDADRTIFRSQMRVNRTKVIRPKL